MEAKAGADPEFGARLDAAHAGYASEREGLIANLDAPRPSGGVGGAATGVKCLHAHYAHAAAGRENPVGQVVADWIGPLDCDVPCVVGAGMNPEWVSKP
jgi:hypothetical protein